MIAESDAASLLETAHLLQSPRNARRIFEALERALTSKNGTPMTSATVEKLREDVADGGKRS